MLSQMNSRGGLPEGLKGMLQLQMQCVQWSPVRVRGFRGSLQVKKETGDGVSYLLVGRCATQT